MLVSLLLKDSVIFETGFPP